MLANRTARWSLGTVALCLVLLVAAWFLLIDPRRGQETDLRDAAVASDSQASQLQIQVAKLKSQASDLPAQKAKLEQIAKQLTPDAGIPDFVRALQQIAAESGVELSSIAPGSPVVVTTGAAATPSTDGAAQAGSLVSVPMALNVSGDAAESTIFLKYLQTKIARTYVISALNVAVTTSTSSGTASVEGTSAQGAAAISQASLDEGSLSAADGDTSTATPAATSKGDEGTTATPAPGVSTAAPGTGTGTVTDPAATATATPDPEVTTTTTTLDITGSIYVLLDGTSTLEDIQKQAAEAAARGTTTATPTPSAGN
ncbi:hypothetical protein [Kineosporia succinea]|uniref:Pilus assembly protein PilO n=1 Tax=Kineosporia succinea TaxID=84632 RepID=A0ABT9NV43_9ACTN|nr:hypothetical protein [Kineosporia succinea]MDP9824305.1 hypothetical protein [Kineosporia succinea]